MSSSWPEPAEPSYPGSERPPYAPQLEDVISSFSWVRQVHTLGPSGTNCERAGQHWLRRKCPAAEICLHASIEAAAECVALREDAVFVGVAAYPHLHSVIYGHIQLLRILDVFIANTDEMVLASRTGAMPEVCATHPAPERLLPPGMARHFSSSNVSAAEDCIKGLADGCITTRRAVDRFDLKIVRSFGSVPMAFTIHGPHAAADADRATCAAGQALSCNRSV